MTERALEGWDEVAQQAVARDERCPVCKCLVDHTSARCLPFCMMAEHRIRGTADDEAADRWMARRWRS